MKHKFLLAATAFFGVFGVSHAQTPDFLKGDLRMRATFESGKPELDVAPGEKMFSRIWRGAAYNKAPENAFPGKRFVLSELIEAGHNSRYAFATKTDVGIRATGALNLQSGSFAGWFRRSEVFEKGGMLLAAKAWPTGGPRDTIHWALGIGGASGSDVPAQKLFVVADSVQSIAENDLPETEWVHIAAVWDKGHGAKLYANGQLLASHWSQSPPPLTGAEPDTPPLYPKGNFVDEIASWRASLGVDSKRRFAPILEAGAFPGVKVTRESSPERNREVLRVEINSDQRLQIRSAKPFTPGKGSYSISVRIRRDQEESGVGSTKDADIRLTVSGPERTEPELMRLKSAPGAPAGALWLEQTVDFNEDDRLIFDLNFNRPGVYFLEEFSVRAAASAQEAGSRVRTTLKLPGGITPFVAASGSYPVERFHLMPADGGAVDDLVVYDFPLNAEGVRELFQGRTPGYSHSEHTLPDLNARLAELGWGSASASDFISLISGRRLDVRQATVAGARENLRAAGWLAVDGFPHSQSPWWYHGYTFLPRTIHLDFEAAIPVNYIAAQGTFTGELKDAQKRSIARIQPAGLLFYHALKKPIATQSVTLHHESGLLDEIGFYSVEEATAEKSGRALSFNLQAAQSEIPLQGAKRDEFVSVYSVHDRSTLIGVPVGQAKSTSMSVPALQTFHLMSPPLDEEFVLGAIGITLRGKTPSNSARLRILVHDALTPWRELSRLDFLLEKEQPEFEAALDLDLRDTLIRKGDLVWVSVVCDQPLEISSSSVLTLHAAADTEHAAQLWRNWELNSVRDRFESLSEPRPWQDSGPEKEESSWLAITTPEYEWLDAGLRVLRERFPDDEIVNSWFSFTHPKGASNPAADIPLPEIGTHPRWAVLLKENLQLYKQFLNWWIDNRRHPNGEWGNFYGDDTDLLQDWLDGALISDPDGRIADSLVHTADAVWHRFKLKDGRPINENGLNNRWTDLLHAYEDGLNIQPQAFFLNYGDPEYLSRLQATAARYDGYLLTPVRNGERRFAGSGEKVTYVSTTRPPEGKAENRAWFLFTHPGLMLSWYNRHPATLKVLRELADGMLDVSVREGLLSGYGGSSFYYGLYRMTGDERYLNVLLDPEQSKDGIRALRGDSITDYSLFGLSENYDPKKTFDWLRQDAETRYETLRTEQLGWGDTRFERNWAEWYLTKDKRYLNEGLEQLYRKTKYVLPSLTVAEQSGDRVAISKQLISRAYLGGVPSARNHSFYPDFAVSYQGLSDDFAALVTENQPDVLQVSFYNFEENPQNGAMKVWNLQPGKYELTAGPDADGDDEMDVIEVTKEYVLERGASVALELPSQKTWVVRLRLLERATPLEERPDAAVSSNLLRRDGSTLHVPVFNLGNKPIAHLKVLLRSTDGRLQQEHILKNLPPGSGWSFVPQEVRFSLPDETTSWILELDPDREIEEITKENNRIVLSAQDLEGDAEKFSSLQWRR